MPCFPPKVSAKDLFFYLDCFSGASGDMLLGALLDLGIEAQALARELKKLPLKGYEFKISLVVKKGLRATSVEIVPTAPQPPRTLPEIFTILEESNLAPEVIQKSKEVFSLLAKAEGQVHALPPSEVHFHEIGAVDSLLDIVGTLVCLTWLKIEKIYASPLPLGRGWGESAHGLIPFPAPATLEVLKGIPVIWIETAEELVTPTGAALLRVLADFRKPPLFKPLKTGYGAGKKELPWPNLLRVICGEKVPEATFKAGLPPEWLQEETIVLEATLDDMNPEFYGYLWEQLTAQGAWEVYLTPVQMKKQRPGTLITVLCPEERAGEISQVLLKESSSLGLRLRREKRIKAPRSFVTVATPYGEVRVKCRFWEDPVEKKVYSYFAPEYEDCKRCALAAGAPLATVYDTAKAIALGLNREK